MELEGGEWIFGRGTGDMKAGAAIQCILLEEYSENTAKPHSLQSQMGPTGTRSILAGARQNIFRALPTSPE